MNRTYETPAGTYTAARELTARYQNPVWVIRREDGTLVATTPYANRVKNLVRDDMARQFGTLTQFPTVSRAGGFGGA